MGSGGSTHLDFGELNGGDPEAADFRRQPSAVSISVIVSRQPSASATLQTLRFHCAMAVREQSKGGVFVFFLLFCDYF